MNVCIEYLDQAVQWLSDGGTLSEAAQKIGVSRAAIWSWQKRGSVPPKRAIQIERLTNGLIKRHQLNPIFKS